MKIKIPPAKEVSAYGRRLREWREQRGISQRRLAQKNNLSLTMLHRVENGTCDPVLSFVIRLVKITGINPLP